MSLSLHRLVALGLFGTALFVSLLPPAYAAPFAYVSSSGDCAELGTARIQVIDTATDTVVGTLLNVDKCPNRLAMGLDGRRLYAGNLRAVPFDVMPDVVGIIDPVRDRFVGGRRVDEPVAIALSPDGRRVYALSQSARELRVINTNGKRQTRVALPQYGSVEWCIIATPDGEKVYACVYVADQPPGHLALAVYQASTLGLLTTIRLPGERLTDLAALPDSSGHS